MSCFVSVVEAKQIIKDQIVSTEKIELSLLESLGFYTAEAICATLDVPLFDNSAMDGYGFCFEDALGFSELSVTKVIPAGFFESGFRLGRGEAVRIFTGAKIPEGVDTVVIQENVEFDDGVIRFDIDKIHKGANIRLKVSQTKKGATIIEANTLINHAVIGFLAGFGIDKVKVYSKLKVELISTGNELVEVGKALSEGKIYNSNRYTLQAALAEFNHGFSFIQSVEDTVEATFSAINNALQKVDVLLITGGGFPLAITIL